MSQITTGTVAYVPSTPDRILDAMVNTLSYTATGDRLVIITRESVQEYLSNNDQPTELRSYLEESLASIDSLSSTPVGEIFFID